MDLLAFVAAGAPLLLESSPSTPGTGRWSYVVIGTSGRLTHDGSTTALHDPAGARTDLGRDAFTSIDELGHALGVTPDASVDVGGPAFVGGLAGALAYDLGRLVERLPDHARADREACWLDLLVADDVVAVDHRDETAWRVRRPVTWPGRPVPPPAGDDVLARVRGRDRPRPARNRARGGPITTSLPEREHRAAIEAVLARIAAGEVFQVNVTQRLTCTWDGDAVELYRRLRAASPAPHGALFVRAAGSAIASVSPETFLHAAGRHVTTRPIKGTRPRSPDPVADVAARDELLDSAKERAENVMVVDMERNDLGRVCVPGTVRVSDLLTAEAHPTVWQLVSTVEGELRDGVGWGGLLRAAFPSGSVTGTPKVRAMTVIDQLEPVRRSWYCGSIGWLGPGSASLSVAIRTAVLHEGVVDHAVGGGIVADSDPTAEIAETWDKAAAFVRAMAPERGVGNGPTTRREIER